MPELLDLTHKFQKFYQVAQSADPDTRWELWQQHYAFAAVPPIPEGQDIARKLLDTAWDKYAGLPADLTRKVNRVKTQVQQAIKNLETLFQTSAPDFRLVTYVGGFEGNAFVAGNSLCLPVKMPQDWLEPVITHELAHLFHHKLSGSTGEWQHSLASVIVEEGIATRTVDLLYPHLPIRQRVGEQNWLSTCENARPALIADALPRLTHDDNDTLMRFTMQPHPAVGVDRTAYAIGWDFVSQWLSEGRTLGELARVPEKELPELVGQRWQ